MKGVGVSYSQQAMALGKGWSSFHHWLTPGFEPKHSEAEAWLKLHSTVCGSELTEQRRREAVYVGLTLAST